MTIPRIGVVDQETIDPHELYYHCPKDGTYFYLVNWGLGILKTDHIFLQKENYDYFKYKWIGYLRIMTKEKEKRDRNIDKAMWNPVNINKNKLFVTV